MASVKYNGRANVRLISREDLSGQPGDSASDVLRWSPGSSVPWETWLEYAGDPERAAMVLRNHRHEFELVGDVDPALSAALEETEFDIGAGAEA